MNVCHDGGPIIAFRNAWDDSREEASDARSGERWLDYCRTREAAERAAAKKASSINAQRVHQELALAYARIIGGERS